MLNGLEVKNVKRHNKNFLQIECFINYEFEW